MLQAIMQTPGKIEFREVSLPEVGFGEVLIRTSHIGICGSDIHVSWPTSYTSRGPGHEVPGGSSVAISSKIQSRERLS